MIIDPMTTPMPEKKITIDDIVLDPPPEGVIVQPATLFESPGDVELEIGCGKGGFLLRRAMQHPEKRFIGIEWANKIYRFTADRMARWSVRNVRILRADATYFVREHLPAECLSAMHVYHPDPWPKKRHHKRRLIQPAFVESAVRTLVVGGRWALQTDHQEYFDQMVECLSVRNDLREVPFEDPAFGSEDGRINTNYEVKYRREQRAIYRVAYEKTTSTQDSSPTRGV